MIPKKIEAGCDEAGRGCLAGPVFAAAVILPDDFKNELLNDSKQLNEKNRYALRTIIEQQAISYAVAMLDNEEIDKINILNASIKAMHLALAALKVKPKHIVVDGNRFKNYGNIAHTTVVKGDGKYANIAAASVLAKTYRDDFMQKIHNEFPAYDWKTNKGYPTVKHRKAIAEKGTSPYHRLTFRLLPQQMELPFEQHITQIKTRKIKKNA
ncbi:MAG: ribonuclease HII [Bacteroidia bacterium]